MITGSGKTDAGNSPTTSPELIRSIGTARILDLICEGPIAGLVNGDCSVLINDTPLKNPLSNLYNFVQTDGVASAVTVNSDNVGTPSQLSIPGFSQVESETAVGVEVLYNQPIVREVSPGIDRIRLRLSAPSLYSIDGNGNTNTTSISYAIDVKDSTVTDFPPLSNLTATLATTLLSIPMTPVIVSGYPTAWQVDLSTVSTTAKPLTQLRVVMSCAFNAAFIAADQTLVYEIWADSIHGGLQMIQRETIGAASVVRVGGLNFILDLMIPVGLYQATSVQIRIVNLTNLALVVTPAWGNHPASTGYAIYGNYSAVSDHYTSLLGPSLSGQHPTKFEISTFDYPLPGTGPWQVRVAKMQADSTDPKIQQTLQWESYTEIVDSKLAYPNSAVFSVVASARQFSSIPTRAYHCRLLLVKIPSNYFPSSKNSDGTWTAGKYTRNALGQDTGVVQGWDGTFYTAWTSNPAWCYYDLVTNTRYGLGKYISASNVNKWALYTIGQYCDGMVPSGYKDASGADILEPRFTLNCYISTAGQAYTLLQSLTSAFRGMVYWAAGQVTATQDSPVAPSHEFTNANVINGDFTYSGTAKRARHNAAIVTWNDPADNYKPATEYVDDPEGIRRYGYNPTNIQTFGCTSRGQAHRFGKWAIYSELNETETCTHKTGLEGTFVLPGQVYKVLDVGRSGVRWGGRVSSATTSAVTLDAPVVFEYGKTYNLTLVDMSTTPPGLTTSAIVAEPGSTLSVMLASPLATPPIAGTPWVLESPDYIEAQLFRCLNVTEDSPGVFQVIGLSYNPGKFAWVEDGVVFDDPPISGQLPAASIISPTGVMLATEDKLSVTGALERHLYLTWDISPQTCITGYQAHYSFDGGTTWTDLKTTGVNRVEIVGPPSGTCMAQVRSINPFGIASPWVSTSKVIIGRTDTPPDVKGLQLLGQGNNQVFVDRDARFTWKQPIPPSAVADQLGDDSYGVGTPYPAGWLSGYAITVYNADGSRRRSDTASTEQYTYSFDKNALDGSGVPVREFTVAVAVITIWGTVSANPARLTVSNPAPAVLT